MYVTVTLQPGHLGTGPAAGSARCPPQREGSRRRNVVVLVQKAGEGLWIGDDILITVLEWALVA